MPGRLHFVPRPRVCSNRLQFNDLVTRRPFRDEDPGGTPGPDATARLVVLGAGRKFAADIPSEARSARRPSWLRRNSYFFLPLDFFFTTFAFFFAMLVVPLIRVVSRSE
jgi:hypothetical protein